MIICLCVRCGEEYMGDPWGFKFCDECFDELGDPSSKEERAYIDMNPEYAEWWQNLFDAVESDEDVEWN